MGLKKGEAVRPLGCKRGLCKVSKKRRATRFNDISGCIRIWCEIPDKEG